jgi:membrane protein DedA with SNARE-associated domain
MNFKKFLTALLIGKISLVYFWGFIGTSLIESFENPIIILKITLVILVAYIISKLVSKKLKL